MNANLVEEIANAVLYEGYMLYPYRTSSVKNRQRWNFGIVYPRKYSEEQRGVDPWFTQTECLVSGSENTEIRAKVRFLQAITRQIGELDVPSFEPSLDSEPPFHLVPTLQVGDRLLQTWQEAAEREVTIAPCSLRTLIREPFIQFVSLHARRDVELVRNESGRVCAVIVRTQEAITAKVELTAAQVHHDVCKLKLRVSNETLLEGTDAYDRECALRQSLLSAHSILGAEQGEFISLLETPYGLQEAARGCANVGTWPVLVGEEGKRDAMLSSPIILYDYPQVAPESPGNLFDGAEIDEILSLRILTLTEEEKREMRQGDERARQILERTESMPAEQFAKLHGTLRGLRPSTEGQQ
jgi:hypothetical protein